MSYFSLSPQWKKGFSGGLQIYFFTHLKPDGTGCFLGYFIHRCEQDKHGKKNVIFIGKWPLLPQSGSSWLCTKKPPVEAFTIKQV